MKKITLIPYRHLRLATMTLSLVVIATFITSLPLSPFPPQTKPLVKAAFTDTPPLPTSHLIPPPATTAKSVFIVDMATGIVLYAKNPSQRLQPASLTKIMTAIVAMDYYNEDSVVSVTNGSRAEGSTADLKLNDKMLANDMLYALLVPSGNDAAVTLAENYPGGYNAFIGKMNQTATKLGLVNSHFSNVSGVENTNHYTTAYDITEMAIYALQRPIFRNIVSTKKITLKSLKGHFYPLETTNLLLGKPGILGVKTGWTPAAGECLVTYADKNNHPIVSSVLGSNDRFGETEKLLNWVYTNYVWQ